MGTTSEGTELSVVEDIQPQKVIVILYLPLSRRYEIVFWEMNIQMVEGL